ncbi:10800_t:CDS:2 [Funneliformis geosporum]|nr:10800_t:CDS:2 [Funneliformis geosporum]
MGFGSNKNQQRKGRWAKWEDDLLKSLVTELSVDSDDIDWSILEKHFDGMRDSKQIRERWVNHLTPSIKKRKFNEKEIQIIEDECAKHKFKWSKISKKIPYATPLMIKNFYNNRLKKKNPPTVRKSCNASAITTYTTDSQTHIN